MESKEPFDVVILDLTNKIGMGGQATMKRLLEINPDVKGIIITGYSDDPVVANFRAYGFSGFITKPATKEELSKVIKEALSKDQPSRFICRLSWSKNPTFKNQRKNL